MTTATVIRKGQITIPFAMREALHVSAGDRIEFVEVAPGRFEFIAFSGTPTGVLPIA
ncbi:MAG: AbrB/MazE/SpoVT family DNA-binding domain-containing protein [Fluviicoccus sp.]|uniref:AbrB/MazE/SpoVT family DNA-binding domain-containing protein n=1 Tax=Fluviicoccus sp. TaxID=2003552 RepID=UPI0027274201|nr:AbrB/MazE/SpoVT family DNA-binding domain-containing protein [Fluviicoccus sp.]MDO8330585.1 AbrB/MazE/SpoVT family DNA-binding domain-containing protein [Fluviicoccus sp.]